MLNCAATPQPKKNPRGNPFLFPTACVLFLGFGRAVRVVPQKPSTTLHNQPKQKADKSLYTKPNGKPTNGRFALFPPCRRCVPFRTYIGLAVFTSLCASFLDAGRASHRKRIFNRSSAAASVPFRRLSAHSPGWRFPTLRIGRPNLDLRSRFGQPVHNPKSLSVLFPPQRLLHSTSASALANPKRSADRNAPH